MRPTFKYLVTMKASCAENAQIAINHLLDQAPDLGFDYEVWDVEPLEAGGEDAEP